MPAAPDAPRDARLGVTPRAALGLCVLGMIAVAAVILLFTPRRSWGHYLPYDVPIAVPFVLFVLERRQGLRERGGVSALALDVAVVALALARSASYILGFGLWPPYVSGHALFLTYALLATRSPAVRITAGLVLLEVVVYKAFLWKDPSLVGGALIGLLAAGVHRPLAHRAGPFAPSRRGSADRPAPGV